MLSEILTLSRMVFRKGVERMQTRVELVRNNVGPGIECEATRVELSSLQCICSQSEC